MLFVFDTNTLLSALLKPEGIPARALAQAIKSGKLLFSEETKKEYHRPAIELWHPAACTSRV